MGLDILVIVNFCGRKEYFFLELVSLKFQELQVGRYLEQVCDSDRQVDIVRGF